MASIVLRSPGRSVDEMAVMDPEALSVSVWPKQQDAAGMLRVDPSRLTRWLEDRKVDVVWIESEKRVRPSAVLHFAEQHQLPVVRVAAELLTHVSDVAETPRVELEATEEINGYLAEYERRRAPRSVASYERFVHDLEHLLPPHVFKEVVARLPDPAHVHSIVGATEDSDQD
jgi:hypothetical protein